MILAEQNQTARDFLHHMTPEQDAWCWMARLGEAPVIVCTVQADDPSGQRLKALAQEAVDAAQQAPAQQVSGVLTCLPCGTLALSLQAPLDEAAALHADLMSGAAIPALTLVRMRGARIVELLRSEDPLAAMDSDDLWAAI